MVCAGGRWRGGGRRRARGWRGASHDGCCKQSRLSARATRCESDGETDPHDRHRSRGDATDQPARGRGLLLRLLRQGRLSLLNRVSRRWHWVAPGWRWLWLVAGRLTGVAWVTGRRALVGGGWRRMARLRLLRISGRRCWVAGRRSWVAGLSRRLVSGRRRGWVSIRRRRLVDGRCRGGAALLRARRSRGRRGVCSIRRGGVVCRGWLGLLGWCCESVVFGCRDVFVGLRRGVCGGGRLDGLGSSAGSLRTCGPAASAEASVCVERRAAALAVILLRYPSAGIHACPPWSRAFIRNELFEPECRTYSTFTAA